MTYQMCTFAEKLHLMLKQDGGIKALLGMFRSGHTDVIAQIARGIANFAKCESRMISQGLCCTSEDCAIEAEYIEYIKFS
jgi:hypothetical protein